MEGRTWHVKRDQGICNQGRGKMNQPGKCSLILSLINSTFEMNSHRFRVRPGYMTMCSSPKISCCVLNLVFQYGIGRTFDFNTIFVLPSKYKEMRAVQGNEREGCDYNDRAWHLSWHGRVRKNKDRREMTIVTGTMAGRVQWRRVAGTGVQECMREKV